MYLDEGVKESKRQDDHGCKRCCHQHDDADLHEFEDVAQHHLQAIRDHAVNGINLFGKAVEQVATGCALEEGHGRAQHVDQQVHVQVARGNDAADGDGNSRTKDGNTWGKVRRCFESRLIIFFLWKKHKYIINISVKQIL